YLTRQFTDQIGISPRQYLTNKRLSMARKDLCSTSLSIQEIAINNGFGDVNYFIQVYKKTYGTTPKKYQLRVRTMV
ncbi:MAG: helix-turn-helix transcriptional regulator, partial [Clostridia bacterium]|nr:helix-turn-helix transcriptional regulator [Clostridia bacterium]